jgi:hypothetical protein
VACEQSSEGERAREAAVLNLVERPLEPLRRELLDQVQRARRGGHRDRALDRDLVGR